MFVWQPFVRCVETQVTLADEYIDELSDRRPHWVAIARYVVLQYISLFRMTTF